MAKLSRAEILGIADALYEAGSAVASTPDPDCVAAALIGEGAWWDELSGRPGSGETPAAAESQRRFREETVGRFDALSGETSVMEIEVEQAELQRLASVFWRGAGLLMDLRVGYRTVMWAVTLQEMAGGFGDLGSE